MKEIDAKKFLEIMKTNFGYKTVKTSLGEGIEMDCYSAFIFSAITGAAYLDDPLYPFTVKGIMKLFYNALEYNFVTGLFDKGLPYNTPYNLSIKKKFLFKDRKIIVPVEFSKEAELINKLKDFFYNEKTIKKTNILILRIEASKRGNGMEPFLEYLSGFMFKQSNYLVETQIPLSYKYGSPDFGGYKIKKFNDYLRKNNLTLKLNKIFLIELSMLRLKWQTLSKPVTEEEKYQKGDTKTFEEDDYFIVGEAKTSAPRMEKQLEKYLDTHFFSEAYELYPDEIIPARDEFGLIYINKNNKINIIPPKKKNNFVDKNKQKEYSTWLSNYIKYFLLANLTYDEFFSFYNKMTNNVKPSIGEIINFVNSLSYDDIFKEIYSLA